MVGAPEAVKEVPVGSETPSWVEANVAVGGGGVSEAQDQQGRGAGSVTERPSPAQLNLKRVPHKSLTGSLGSHGPVSNPGSPSDRVSQAGVDREPQSLPSGEAPVPYPTSEQLQVPQHDPGEFVLVGTEGVMTAAEMPCGSQGPGPTGACSDSGVSKAPVQRKRPSQDVTDSPNKRSEAHVTDSPNKRSEAQVLGEEERLVLTDSRTADSPQGALPREGAGVGSQERAQQASEQEAASQEEGWEGHPKPKQVKGAVPKAAGGQAAEGQEGSEGTAALEGGENGPLSDQVPKGGALNFQENGEVQKTKQPSYAAVAGRSVVASPKVVVAAQKKPGCGKGVTVQGGYMFECTNQTETECLSSRSTSKGPRLTQRR